MNISINDNDKVSGSDILEALGLSEGDTVNFDSNDTVFKNGYEVMITKNNGKDGGTIHIKK